MGEGGACLPQAPRGQPLTGREEELHREGPTPKPPPSPAAPRAQRGLRLTPRCSTGTTVLPWGQATLRRAQAGTASGLRASQSFQTLPNEGSPPQPNLLLDTAHPSLSTPAEPSPVPASPCQQSPARQHASPFACKLLTRNSRPPTPPEMCSWDSLRGPEAMTPAHISHHQGRGRLQGKGRATAARTSGHEEAAVALSCPPGPQPTCGSPHSTHDRCTTRAHDPHPDHVHCLQGAPSHPAKDTGAPGPVHRPGPTEGHGATPRSFPFTGNDDTHTLQSCVPDPEIALADGEQGPKPGRPRRPQEPCCGPNSVAHLRAGPSTPQGNPGPNAQHLLGCDGRCPTLPSGKAAPAPPLHQSCPPRTHPQSGRSPPLSSGQGCRPAERRETLTSGDTGCPLTLGGSQTPEAHPRPKSPSGSSPAQASAQGQKHPALRGPLGLWLAPGTTALSSTTAGLQPPQPSVPRLTRVRLDTEATGAASSKASS